MRPLMLCCTIHRHVSWEGLEKFEEGREHQDFSFELFWKFDPKSFFSLEQSHLHTYLALSDLMTLLFDVNLRVCPSRDHSCLDFQGQIYLMKDSP